MRKIETHKVNPANDLVEITAQDEPGAGGANHHYHVTWGRSAQQKIDIRFQNGPIAEAGVNGVTQEVLLAIVQDRLEAFQAGPYACEENAAALKDVKSAQKHLLSRTTKRMARGVEGTHKK